MQNIIFIITQLENIESIDGIDFVKLNSAIRRSLSDTGIEFSKELNLFGSLSYKTLSEHTMRWMNRFAPSSGFYVLFVNDKDELGVKFITQFCSNSVTRVLSTINGDLGTVIRFVREYSNRVIHPIQVQNYLKRYNLSVGDKRVPIYIEDSTDIRLLQASLPGCCDLVIVLSEFKLYNNLFKSNCIKGYIPISEVPKGSLIVSKVNHPRLKSVHPKGNFINKLISYAVKKSNDL